SLVFTTIRHSWPIRNFLKFSLVTEDVLNLDDKMARSKINRIMSPYKGFLIMLAGNIREKAASSGQRSAFESMNVVLKYERLFELTMIMMQSGLLCQH
ncbi:MAG: hypothetical protein Q7U02_07925, partial [Desulfosalsimonadaceae bacterium]|nr:hypothetical protein [Desulfosalsimonadaceae bacterium]